VPWYSFQPYVSVEQRRRKAQAAIKTLAGAGRVLAPVRIEGRKIASTYWGKAWCDNLESYSDYQNRLPRGRSYVRNGSVVDLQIVNGKIKALVQGSALYEVSIAVNSLKAAHWQQFKTRCAGKITNLLDLMQGRLSSEILADVTAHATGLFPSPPEMELQCSCLDWAEMCKHVAAVLYGVGARLDKKPELFFTLRAVDVQELITAASAGAIAAPAAGSALDDASLSEIFGVEIETGSVTAAAEAVVPDPAKAAAAPKARRRPAAKATVPRSSKAGRKPKSPSKEKAEAKISPKHPAKSTSKRKKRGK
jgi:uncharacterized Zn finger protein